MAHEEFSEKAGKQESHWGRKLEQDLELWKHFATFGGEDKNIMVAVVSWILGFSATIIGYIVTELLEYNWAWFTNPLKTFVIALLGGVASYAAGYVALLYGGYAN